MTVNQEVIGSSPIWAANKKENFITLDNRAVDYTKHVLSGGAERVDRTRLSNFIRRKTYKNLVGKMMHLFALRVKENTLHTR